LARICSRARPLAQHQGRWTSALSAIIADCAALESTAQRLARRSRWRVSTAIRLGGITFDSCSKPGADAAGIGYGSEENFADGFDGSASRRGRRAGKLGASSSSMRR